MILLIQSNSRAMKNVTILIAIFLVFFVKNTVVAQTKESKFSVQVEPLSGKKVLFYNGHLFLGNKDDAEKFRDRKSVV